MIICNNCGRENEDEYKFCLGCGSALPKPQQQEKQQPKMIDCPHCGTEVPSNFKFCGACGGPIAAAQPAGAAAQAASAQPAAAQPAPAQAAQPAQQAQQAAQPARPAAAQQPSGAGRLVIIRPDGSEGDSVPLGDGEQTIGRSSSVSALSNDPFLSPKHATFEYTGDGFRVRDEDSLNGVFVRIEKAVDLHHGDQIRLGQELLRFEVIDQLEPILEPKDDEDTELTGSLDSHYWARLSVIAGPGLITRAFALADDEITIGREVGDLLFREDGFVSGTHARVARSGDGAILEDLGSSNGTYLRIRGETKLEHGDLVLMGQQLFRVVVD